MSRRAVACCAVTSALAAALLGCDDGQAGPLVPDLGPPPDAGPEGPCTEVLFDAGRFVLQRCVDQARWAIATRRPLGALSAGLSGLGPGAMIDGRVMTPDDWPTIVWRLGSDGLTVDYGGRADGLVGSVTLRDDGDCLLGDTTIGGEPGVVVEHLYALLLSGPDALAPGLGGATLGPEGPADGFESPPEARPRVVVGPAQSTLWGAVAPDRPLWTAAPAIPASDKAVPIMTLRGPFTLGESPVEVPWALCIAPSPTEALDALGARVAAALDLDPRPVGARLSVRLGFDPEAPTAARTLATRLGEVAGALGQLWIEGWAADTAEWIPYPAIAGAPEIPALSALAAPARVGVIWPLLTLPPDAALAVEHPDWLDPDCSTGCPRLDPRVPAVREHLARIRLALGDAGLDVRLAGTDHLPPATLRTLLGALAVGDGPPPELEPPAERAMPPVELGITRRIPLTPATDVIIASEHARTVWLDPYARPEPDVLLDPLGDLPRRTALALITGHGRVEAISADNPDPFAFAAPVLAVWQQPAHQAPARPIPRRWFTAGAAPTPAPSDWAGPGRLILFNWGDAPRVVDDPANLAPDLVGAPRLLQPDAPPLGAADQVIIPPGGVVIWATVDGGPADE